MLAERSRATADTAPSKGADASSSLRVRRVREAARRAAFAAFVLLVIVFFAAVALGEAGVTRILKPLPVMALAVWAALDGADAEGAASAVSRARRAVVGGLVASAIGDALLDVPIDGAFVAGMVAFACAHLAYIAAMIIRHRLSSLGLGFGLAVPFAVWGVGLFLGVRGGLGPLVTPVAVYAVVICAMMWRAAARHAEERSRATLIGLVGALLFGLSDSLLAVKLSGVMFPGLRVFVLFSYWAGQAGIAASFARWR